MAEMAVPGLEGRGAMESKGVFSGCGKEGEAVESFGGETRAMGNGSPSGFVCYPAG